VKLSVTVTRIRGLEIQCW